MRLILFKNEEKCDSIAVATVEDFSDIIGQNQPCRHGAAKMPACFVKALELRVTKLFVLCLSGKHFSAQQNLNLFRGRA